MIVYSDLVAAVVQELGPDGNRRGIESLRSRAIRDALIDLQRYIRAYRQGHITRYTADDLDEIGFAHLGQLPDQAKPKAFYIACAPGTAEVTPSTGITSWAELAALPTIGLPLPQLRIWVDSTELVFRATQLRAGTDATDTANGIQRPDDYNATSNARVWYSTV